MILKYSRITGIVLTVLLAGIIFSGCERIKEVYGKKDAEQTEREAPIFAVNTTLAVHGQINDYISLSGDIVSGSTVDVYSNASGKVSELYTAVGRRLNRGDPIAAVDPSMPGMTYRHNIATAPISGTVVSLTAQVGMTVSQAVPLARIAGGGALEIKLNVAERFISKMAMDLPCEITLDAWPGEIFQGSISEIAPTVDPVSRTMEMRVNVNNADSKLKAGMFAKVKIITEHKDNIVKIPASAMLSRYGEHYVYVVERDPENPEQNIVRKRVVIQGILIDGTLEIQNGLAPNEEVVMRGQTLLDDGARVNVIEQLTPLSVN